MMDGEEAMTYWTMGGRIGARSGAYWMMDGEEAAGGWDGVGGNAKVDWVVVDESEGEQEGVVEEREREEMGRQDKKRKREDGEDGEDGDRRG